MSVGYKTFGFCNGQAEEKRGSNTFFHPCSATMPNQILHHDLLSMPGLVCNMRMNAAKLGWTRDGDKDYCPECSKRRGSADEVEENQRRAMAIHDAATGWGRS